MQDITRDILSAHLQSRSVCTHVEQEFYLLSDWQVDTNSVFLFSRVPEVRIKANEIHRGIFYLLKFKLSLPCQCIDNTHSFYTVYGGHDEHDFDQLLPYDGFSHEGKSTCPFSNISIHKSRWSYKVYAGVDVLNDNPRFFELVRKDPPRLQIDLYKLRL